MTTSRGRKYSKLEIRAERRACIETDETSYVEILRSSGKAAEWASWEIKKKKVVECIVRAQDIFHESTWKKFLAEVFSRFGRIVKAIDTPPSKPTMRELWQPGGTHATN